MKQLFAMSAAGTVPLGLYYLVKLIYRERYPAYEYKRILKLSIFFFLCPIHEMKYMLPRSLKDGLSFLYDEDFMYDQRIFIRKDGIVPVRSSDGMYWLAERWVLILFGIWLALTVGFVIYSMGKYMKLKRKIVRYSEKVPKEYEQYMREQCSKTGYVRIRNVSFRKSQLVKSPFTIGVLAPGIILPDRELDDEHMKMILLHEMVHIKNRDIFYKTVCLMIVVLHWYNPAAWLLLHEYGSTAEYICDETVIQKYCSLREKQEYAALLVNMSVSDPAVPAVYTDYLSRGARRMKRRIDNIIFSGKKKRGFFPVILLISLVFWAQTIAAYQTEPTYDEKVFEGLGDAEDVFIFIPENPSVYALKFDEYGSQMLGYDIETKEYFPISQDDLIEERVGCNHIYSSIDFYKHIPMGADGCIIELYSAKKCSECGNILLGRLVDTFTYSMCIHGG